MNAENEFIKNKNYTTNPALEADYFYVDYDKIVGDRDGKWEHHGTHTIDDPMEYWKTFPPVPVEKIKDKYVFSDGFNRVNFCIKNKMRIPVVRIFRKPATHTHEVDLCGMRFLAVIFDKDCEAHKKDNRVIRCNKGKGHIYPLRPKEEISDKNGK